jgi:hypothetical protein
MIIPSVIRTSVAADPIITFSPNPTTGNFTLEIFGEETFLDATCRIYNMMGEKVMQHQLSVNSRTEMSLSGQPAGIYIISVINGSETSTSRIIKQ